MVPELSLSPISTYEILYAKFKKLAITVDQLTELTGEKPQSIRNAICSGKYPIASYAPSERKRLFLLIDVAHYIDTQRRATLERALHVQAGQADATADDKKAPRSAGGGNPVAPPLDHLLAGTRPKGKRGRPSKREVMLRAQATIAK